MYVFFNSKSYIFNVVGFVFRRKTVHHTEFTHLHTYWHGQGTKLEENVVIHLAQNSSVLYYLLVTVYQKTKDGCWQQLLMNKDLFWKQLQLMFIYLTGMSIYLTSDLNFHHAITVTTNCAFSVFFCL